MKKNENELKTINSFPRWKVSSTISLDLVHSLILSDSFRVGIQTRRKNLDITTTGYKKDFDKAFFIWLDIEDHGVDGEPDFHFLRFDSKGKIKNQNPRQRAVGEAALDILKDYNLPANFLYWVISWILFNEAPSWMPRFNYVPLEDLELQTAHKLPLTTQEKRALKRDIRGINNNLKGNPHLPADYSKISKSIDESNNSRRRLQNLERDLKVSEEMGKRRFKKDKVLKDSAYIDVLRRKGHTDEEIKQMSKKQKQLYGEDFVVFEVRGKYTSRTIEAKFTRDKVRKNKGAFARKRFERLKNYAKKKVVN